MNFHIQPSHSVFDENLSYIVINSKFVYYFSKIESGGQNVERRRTELVWIFRFFRDDHFFLSWRKTKNKKSFFPCTTTSSGAVRALTKMPRIWAFVIGSKSDTDCLHIRFCFHGSAYDFDGWKKKLWPHRTRRSKVKTRQGTAKQRNIARYMYKAGQDKQDNEEKNVKPHKFANIFGVLWLDRCSSTSTPSHRPDRIVTSTRTKLSKTREGQKSGITKNQQDKDLTERWEPLTPCKIPPFLFLHPLLFLCHCLGRQSQDNARRIGSRT